jgi:hypothetical protein
MMAVNRPASGLRPLAMAKAMASGSATTPTVMPAPRSAKPARACVARQGIQNAWAEGERDRHADNSRPVQPGIEAISATVLAGCRGQRTRMPGWAPGQGSST